MKVNLHVSPACVARAARCRAQWGFRPEGRGVVLASTSSTPRRENTAGCGASPAAAGSWCEMRVKTACRAEKTRLRQWRPFGEGPAGGPSAVRRWGSRVEVKALGGSRCPSIVDDEQRRDRPRPPSARRVAAPWPRLLRCRSSAMENIAVVAAPGIRGHGARNGRHWGPRPGLAGRGVVLASTSSTPRRENTAGCGASPAAAGSR